MINKNHCFFTLVLLSLTQSSFAQINVNTPGQLIGQNNSDALNSARPITTAVPFLTITPDARAAGMGDVGAATSPDANATYWNPAKLAFVDKKFGFSVSYNPWLRKLVGDMSLSYLTGYYRLRKEDVVAVSLTYFDLGSITFTDNSGNTISNFNPKEYAFSGTYSRQLGKGFSAGLSARFIYSNLTGNISNSTNLTAKPGTSGAVDLGFYWKRDVLVQGQKLNVAIGTNISNVGAKLSYTNSDQADFLPTNLRLGYALTYELDDYNKIVWATDFNKLMVPSPQLVYYQSNRNPGQDSTYNGVKVAEPGVYTTPQKGLVSGMLGSFSDAPNGFKEEMQEVNWSSGLEYWYNDIFAVRGGYFHESPYKGARQYCSVGFGFRYQTIGFDFAYLIPTTNANSPLANTLRFALMFNFNKSTPQKEESVTE